MMEDVTPFEAKFYSAGAPQPVPERDLTPFEAKFFLAGEQPEWSDDRIPVEQRATDYLRHNVVAGKKWDEVAPAIKEKFGIEPDQMKSGFMMESAKLRASTKGEGMGKALDVIPFAGTAASWYNARDYGRAKKRIEEGKAEDSDYDTVAQFERLDEIKKNESTGESLLRAGTQLPAFAIEALAGGALARGARVGLMGKAAATPTTLVGKGANLGVATAAAPVFWAEQGARNVANAPKDRGEAEALFRGYGAAYLYGAAQNAIVGQLLKPAAAKTTLGMVGEGAKKVGYGMAEQQAVDIAADPNAIFPGIGLPDIQTGGGIAGEALRSDGHPLRHAAVQAFTFAAFAGMHALSRGASPKEAEQASSELVGKFNTAIEYLKSKSKMTDLEAARHLNSKAGANIEEIIRSAKKEARPITEEDFAKMFSGLEEGPVKAYAEMVAKAVAKPNIDDLLKMQQGEAAQARHFLKNVVPETARPTEVAPETPKAPEPPAPEVSTFTQKPPSERPLLEPQVVEQKQVEPVAEAKLEPARASTLTPEEVSRVAEAVGQAHPDIPPERVRADVAESARRGAEEGAAAVSRVEGGKGKTGSGAKAKGPRKAKVDPELQAIAQEQVNALTFKDWMDLSEAERKVYLDLGVKPPTVTRVTMKGEPGGEVSAAGKTQPRGGEEAVLTNEVARQIAEADLSKYKGDPAKMRAALTDVMSGMSLRDAAKKHGLNYQTLKNWGDTTFGKSAFKKLQEDAATREGIRKSRFSDFLEDEDGTIYLDKLGSKIKEWFKSGGHLPGKTKDFNQERLGRIDADERAVRNSMRDFEKVIKEQYGIRMDQVPRAVEDQINAIYEGSQAPTLLVPQPVRDAVKVLRDNVDVMIQNAVNSGAVQGKMAVKFTASMGTHVHRTYQAFTDADFKDRTLKEHANTPGGKREVNAFLARLAAEDAAKGINRTDKERFDEMVSLLKEGEVANEGRFIKGGKLGAKDTTPLRERKNLWPELRDLWGEHKDIRARYTAHMAKLSHLIANHQFQEKAIADGMGVHFFDKPYTAPDGTEYVLPMTPKNYDASGPMGSFAKRNIHTSEEIKKAFEEIYTPDVVNGLGRVIARATMASKMSATALSHVSGIHNLMGNVPIAVSNGHWRIWKFPKAFKAVLAESSFGRWLLGDTQAMRDFHRELAEERIIGDSTREGELRDVMTRAELKGQAPWYDKMQRAVMTPFKAASAIYRAADDLFKVYGYLNEKVDLKAAYPTASEAQIRYMAGQTIREIYPSHSRVPKFFKSLGRQPFIGAFVSFTSEMVRTRKNLLLKAWGEINDPNPKVKLMGWRRLAGFGAALAGSWGAAIATRSAFGVSPEEELAMRRFLPDWSQDSTIVHLPRDPDGKRRFLTLGSTDPHAYFHEPFFAIMRGKDPSESIENAAMAMVKPFIGEELLARRLLDVWRNKKEGPGKPEVYNEYDTRGARVLDQAKHVGAVMVPGSAKSLLKLGQAAAPETFSELSAAAGLPNPLQKEGKAPNLQTEVINNAMGQRIQTEELDKNLMYRAKGFNRAVRGAESIALDPLRSKGFISDDDMVNFYARSEQQRREIWEEFRRDIHAARILGMSQAQVYKTLKEGGLSAQDASDVVNGHYRPNRIKMDQLPGVPRPEAARRMRLMLTESGKR